MKYSEGFGTSGGRYGDPTGAEFQVVCRLQQYEPSILYKFRILYAPYMDRKYNALFLLCGTSNNNVYYENFAFTRCFPL